MAVLTCAVVAGMYNAVGKKLMHGLLEKGWRVFFLTADTSECTPGCIPGSVDIQVKGQSAKGLSVITVDFTQQDSLAAAKKIITEETSVIDLLVSNIDYIPSGTSRTITEGLVFDEMQKTYDINTLGALRVFSTFYELLAGSAIKRIGAVMSVEGCNNICTGTDHYGYAMSHAALTMQFNILFNRLRPEGYTFRLYAAGPDEETNGDYIVDYVTRTRSYEPENPKHSDENRLAPRDATGRELPW